AKMRLPDAGDSFAYWKPFLDKWHITLPPQLFWKFWFASEESVPEMVGLAESLRERGISVFILSNNFAERTQYYERQFPFLHCVPNALYYSWQTGFVKSDPRAYKKVLEDNALEPEEVLFFDDSEEHIRVAKELGISAHLFQDIRGAREALKRHGLC
ncbi:MAG: HAD-IA family hydrolase, partial [Candidatus Harrisonbacteria bacterium]|nr:HAD-IA family hydrolase [Candidatus Harrisonbacteria bacterium]